MTDKLKHHILCIDDDPDMRNLAKRHLVVSGFRVDTADNGVKGLEMIKEEKPDLVLLDIMMPELDGYDVCARLQQDSETSYIPVIFVTSLGYEQNKVRAFAAGAVDYIVKPFEKEVLLEKVNAQLKKTDGWKKLKDSPSCNDNTQPYDFAGFKNFLISQLQLPDSDMEQLADLKLPEVYETGVKVGIKEDIMAEHIARFTKLPYISYINPDEIHLGKLPTPFCIANKIVPLKDKDGVESLVVCNPFNIELFDCIKQYACHEPTCKIMVTAPDNINISEKHPEHKSGKNILDIQGLDNVVIPVKETVIDVSKVDIEKSPVVYAANNIILKAVSERASDIHIEPKEHSVVVRFRIDGVMRNILSLEPKIAVMVISR
ncbi:MAG: ATPase, T2SS/T4P/T4SS family, partial [Candidatus Anammoxibacter sp.]